MEELRDQLKDEKSKVEQLEEEVRSEQLVNESEHELRQRMA